MRETTVTVDDITVQAAKGKLATIVDRPGYADALKPTQDRSRTGQLILGGLTLVFGVLTLVCWTTIDSGLLRVVLVVVFTALTLFGLLATFGSAPDSVPATWGAVVVGESLEQRTGDGSPQHRIVLLDEAGAQHELVTDLAIAGALRVGDLGVAHVRTTAGIARLVQLVRL